MSMYSLTAARPGVASVLVDGLELRFGVPVDLTDEQAGRVRAIPGVVLDGDPAPADSPDPGAPDLSPSPDPGGSPAPTERNDPS